MDGFTSVTDDIEMSCDGYISRAVGAIESVAALGYRRHFQNNAGNATGNWSQSTAGGGSSTASNIDDTIATVNHIAVSAVSIFGIAGNVLNLIVLTRRQLQRLVINTFIRSALQKVKIKTIDIHDIGIVRLQRQSSSRA
jgi:hypothetical protein